MNEKGHTSFWGIAVAIVVGVTFCPLIVDIIEGTRIWQDVVLMVAGFIFAPALIVSIYKRAKYPLLTSLPTAIALTAIVVCYVTLGLHLAAISTGLTTICWYILAIRR